MLQELEDRAKMLEDATTSIASTLTVAAQDTAKRVINQINIIDKKIDTTTGISQKAADASAEAAHVANDLNKKIETTAQSVLTLHHNLLSVLEEVKRRPT
jgi:hypothetical protein